MCEVEAEGVRYPVCKKPAEAARERAWLEEKLVKLGEKVMQRNEQMQKPPSCQP